MKGKTLTHDLHCRGSPYNICMNYIAVVCSVLIYIYIHIATSSVRSV